MIRLLTIAGLFALACSSDELDGTGIEIRGANGEVPSTFRAILSDPGAEPRAITCPGGSARGIECTRRGLALREVAAGAELTIKARGHAFVTETASAARIELPALAEFRATDHFRTGVTPEDGEAAFSSLAVASQTELGAAHSVKFYVEGLRGEPEVYFQNTRRHPLHFGFASLVLGAAASREEFAQRTYTGENRDGLAGTLIHYPELSFESASGGGELRAPLALEFFPSDDLSPELALRAHRLIEERLQWLELEGAERRLTYVPAGSAQEAALEERRQLFSAREALVSDHVELYAGVDLQILNPGLAYGTLSRFEPDELARAVLSSRDIVVLARLPNDLPLVGGTITEELQTPLAHVNLAARARGTPNLALEAAGEDPRVEPLLGKLVRFEVVEDGFSLTETTLQEAQEFWGTLAREPLVPEADLDFTGLPGFEEIEFSDAIRVGVKAANLAELRRLLGENAPIGFAVPFSAYENYMAENRVTTELCVAARGDCGGEGRAAELCDAALARCEASARDADSFYGFVEHLVSDSEVTTSTALREACIDGLHYAVGHGVIDAEFAAALDARVESVFGSGQVRLRSSTNAEDLPGFSGAGLYESVSADAGGDRRPSLRIREVWASVWLWRAFEERQFWNVDHRAVRMAVALNPAIDDEAANGVLITENLLAPGSAGHYVNVQFGEVEVANPESGAVPEVFAIVPGPGGDVQVMRQRFSTLSPDAPLLSDAEIRALADVADRVQAHFAPLYGIASSELALDLEFKFHGPERQLLVKQARPYSR